MHNSRTHQRRTSSPVLALAVAGVLVAGFIGYAGLRAFQAQDRAPAVQFPPISKPPAQPPAVSSGPSAAQTAPDFSVDTLEHGRFTLSEQRGKPTVLFFTASWCLPCFPQLQALARIQNQVGPDKLGVIVLDVDPSEGVPELRRLKASAGGPAYPFALDAGSRVTLLYGVHATDTKIFVSRAGALIDRIDGIALGEGELRARVASLVVGT